MTVTNAAKKSSAIIPIPNLIFSDFLIKLNFVISKNLNNKKPIKCINGFRPENDDTINWPAASSITTQPGSFLDILLFNLKQKYVPQNRAIANSVKVYTQP